MAETAVVKAEAAEVSYNLGSLSVSKPGDVISVATSVATPLSKLVAEKGLFKNISGRKYVYVEGWTTMGAMLGVVPRHIPDGSKRGDDGEYEETVEIVRVTDGMVLGRAAAVCGGTDDKVWHSRPEYARKSMAITRATGKAFRLSFSWIMTLAGYMPTPAEEMDDADENGHTKQTKAAGNGHDESDKKFKEDFAERYRWFKSFKAEEQVMSVLGAAGYTKASEVPADKRASFLKALDDAKAAVKAMLAEKEPVVAEVVETFDAVPVDANAVPPAPNEEGGY